ncbi:P-type conjugative transfer protein TrbG [Vibrio parahaemolyticus]|uniref:P-type conjugative transfer protein TrbG n=1 Tax=Vibrio parahaemolyticus TaxID=670 RepID=UPI001782DD3C|nr:P-type conjugative transfer protein TrbG [Vibrio parahaemolyticus]MBD6944388.1 P-type conjugative transfer protein TrbG [Vibrio parahaemolyticus]MBD6978931.1 P-type conjugative transfer protein TrbG [Vibrio parahaemolyticus]MBD6990936.1 P-type conjugative transfer protein TrbG [Vibrio parahaemolyticus]WOZ62897.1 P-type conjugative transfer protein TrbG [Vibrio parahaemolyticus]
MKKYLLPTLLVASTCALAQPVPAIQSSENLMLGQNQPLTAKEREGLKLVNKWINGTERPITRGDGSVTYFYGATLPQVVCSPLKTCDIQLEAGERITKKGVHIGDTVRWSVSPALSGAGAGQITHLIVKPSDVGLSTTLVVATDKRTYTIALSSRQDDWMPTVNFDYPEQVQAEWDNYYAVEAAQKEASTLGNGLNIDNLDFNYDISGAAAFKPVRVYNNSIKTILEMPASVSSGELPTLLVVNAGKREVVNYRYREGKFIVDQLANEIVLIMGVGRDQESVIVKRKGVGIAGYHGVGGTPSSTALQNHR